jgi:FAD/FMN-containing dehydrogenase
MAAAARSLVEAAGARVKVLTDHDERALWEEHERIIWGGDGTVLKVAVLPTDVSAVLSALEACPSFLEWFVAGRAALGVLYVRMTGPVGAQRDAVERLGEAARRGGSVSALVAPHEIRACAALGPASPAAARLMRAIKARFDPHGILPPAPGSDGRAVTS